MIELIKSIQIPTSDKIELFAQRGKESSKNVLLIGGFHGEEPQGVVALNYYLKNPKATKNNLFIIPCLNPSGYKINKRTNFNDVDLNRNFPTKNWILTDKDDFFGGVTPASENETKFLIDVIEEVKPDMILTLHSPFRIVNYDGPAQFYANKISEIIDYPIQGDIGYPTPGSFGTYCGVERQIPTITLEFDEKDNIEHITLKTLEIIDFLSKM